VEAPEVSSAREAFLEGVRQAVNAGNRPGVGTTVEARNGAGYQGAGPDPAIRFRDELTAAGGQPHLVPDRETAIARVLELVRDKSARRVLVGRGAFLDTLGLPARLREAGCEVVEVDDLGAESSREAFFAADLGISGVNYLIAETGSVVLHAAPNEPRSLSLLPPVHIAVADRTQLLPDLFDLFETFTPEKGMPSCVSVITGPSKTGDIELRLVTGVHGPGEIDVVLVTT
jgi:L-lactate dehydrogenase complex protein LldG